MNVAPASGANPGSLEHRPGLPSEGETSPEQSVKLTDVGSDTPQGSLPEAKTWTAMINARSRSQGEGQGGLEFVNAVSYSSKNGRASEALDLLTC
jgi:hypothetical protein